MSDIEVLGQLAPVLGPAPSDSTVRRTLNLADDRTLTKIAQARARIRRHVWELIEAARGFPWLRAGGKELAGWTVIDMDGTLVTAHSDKEGAAPTWKKGYGFHPLAAWCMNTRECLDMKLRPGNAGSNTFSDHKEVLDAALKQVPAAFRRKVIVRIDGAGASHELVEHLLTLSTKRKTLLFTCGWTITESDEAAIMAVPEGAWKPGITQDGAVEDGQGRRRDHGPAGQGRELARRAAVDRPPGQALAPAPEEPHRMGEENRLEVLDHLHEHPGHRNRGGVPGSHHPQYIDVVHRDHATVETDGVRTAKAMGLRNLPSKTWQVNKGWILAANIAADLTAWARHLGLHDQDDLKDAEPDTLRYRIWHLPARLVRHARKGSSRSARTGPGKTPSSPAGSGSAHSPHPADQHQLSRQHGRRSHPGAVGAGADPGTPGNRACRPAEAKRT